MKASRESRGALIVLCVALLPILYVLGLGPVHFFMVLYDLPGEVLLVYEPLERACEKSAPSKKAYYRYIGWCQTEALKRVHPDWFPPTGDRPRIDEPAMH